MQDQPADDKESFMESIDFGVDNESPIRMELVRVEVIRSEFFVRKEIVLYSGIWKFYQASQRFQENWDF